MSTASDTPVEEPSQVPGDARSAKPLIVAIAIAIVAFVAYMALGMPGMDHSPTQQTPDHQMDGM